MAFNSGNSIWSPGYRTNSAEPWPKIYSEQKPSQQNTNINTNHCYEDELSIHNSDCECPCNDILIDDDTDDQLE